MATKTQSNYGISDQYMVRTVLILVLRIIILVRVPFKLPMCMSNLPWWLVFYILFKASTHSVVLGQYCHGALLHVFCFYSVSVSLSGPFTHLFFSCIYPILIINSRLSTKVH